MSITRKNLLVTGETYHIFTRSIASFNILNTNGDFERMKLLIKYYSINNNVKFSDFISFKYVRVNGFNNTFQDISKDKNFLVQIIAYCFMPTHIHLILKQLEDKGISEYMSNILNSYTRHFNTKHKRKGPLWESRFKNVLVENDEQLMHLTRYIHLNPVTADLTDKPEDWKFSSYHQYLSETNDFENICQFKDVLEFKSQWYQKFVNDQISYQKELAKIKKLIFD